MFYYKEFIIFPTLLLGLDQWGSSYLAKYCTFLNFSVFFLKQNERLRLLLQEQRKQQLALMQKKIK
jgi:hypothetical protein